MSGAVSEAGGASGRALPKGRRSAARAASFGIVAVLLALGACAAWGAASTYQADVAVKRAAEETRAMEQARRAASTLRYVRRIAGAAPGEDVRNQHREASTSLATALQSARIFADPSDRRQIEELIARQSTYLRAAGPLFGESSDGSVPLRVFDPTRGDAARSDQAFYALESLLDQTSERASAEAMGLLNALVTIQTQVFIGGPLLFALGLTLIATIWRMQRSLDRRGTQQLVRDAYHAGAAERQSHGLVDQAPDLMLICAGPGNVTYQNRAAQTVWAHAEDGLVGKSILMFAHPDDRAALRAWWEQMRPAAGADSLPALLEIRLRDGDGDWRVAELRGLNLLHDTVVKGIMLTIRDIGERHATEQQAQHNALYDPMTRLPNALLLRDRLGQAMIRAARRKDNVGVMSVSIDRLQPGDESAAMDAVARLMACVRPQDTVAQTGPAAFIILREAVASDADVLAVAEAIPAEFSRPIAGHDTPSSVRIGVALGDPRRDQADDLVRNAGLAMHQVMPGSAIRHVLFGSSVQSDTLDRVELESDLRSLMQRRDWSSEALPQFRVHFQPIVSMRRADIRGVEALIRWQHPVHGLVPPRNFIPMAEETGLIVPLGQWVLEEGCRRVMAWQQQFRLDPPLTLSVNLSALQFQQHGLVDDVARALHQSGMEAASLRLEITEGTIMQDAEAAVRTLWALKELGVQLAIDDFGAGYSALSYLKQLPLGLLKIDGSFISGIGTDSEDTSIVRAIMSLAKSLGWGVTAEGIETENQAALLNGWGCEYGQGYYFGRPLDSIGTEALLRETAARRAPAPRLLHEPVA